jgi:hypothetical protein
MALTGSKGSSIIFRLFRDGRTERILTLEAATLTFFTALSTGFPQFINRVINRFIQSTNRLRSDTNRPVQAIGGAMNSLT